MMFFINSKYIWADGLQKKQNLSLGFVSVIAKGDYKLYLTASSLYRLYVNGNVVSYGPARAPHGFARVDVVSLGKYLNHPENIIAIEVIGYKVDNFYIPNSKSFLRAEIRDTADTVIKATGNGDNFIAYNLKHRGQNSERITVQRHFVEQYDFKKNGGGLAWYRHIQPELPEIAVCSFAPDLKLLDRTAPLWEPSSPFSGKLIRQGTVHETMPAQETGNEKVTDIRQRYTWTGDGPDSANDYLLFDFGRNRTGFIRCELECIEDAEIILAHEEILLGKDFSFTRAWWANNVIKIKLSKGQKLQFESFEAYVCKYLAVFILKGKISSCRVALREYAFPRKCMKLPVLPGNVPKSIHKIFTAAIETFRQNAVDTFMDCPGRERAAWLCDSFYIARASYFLTGNTVMEDIFIENFLLPDGFKNLPHGMLPMCYPADTKQFIPQWPMWLILQIDEYREQRGGKRDFPKEFKDKFLDLVSYFDKFINEYGLLESLDGWNVIEWSKAKDYLGGVHFPTNMLYAKCLDILSKWYGIGEFHKKAGQIKDFIRRYTFDGGYFADNAVRLNGKLTITGNHSEICQYFAFFMDIIDPNEKKWKNMFRKLADNNADIRKSLAPVNMFIGRIMRLDLLQQNGFRQKVIAESIQHFVPMAKQTGTLWEKDTPDASCCHGFASFIAVILYETYMKKTVSRRHKPNPQYPKQTVEMPLVFN